jgi:hypothetical protein
VLNDHFPDSIHEDILGYHPQGYEEVREAHPWHRLAAVTKISRQLLVQWPDSRARLPHDSTGLISRAK